MAEPLTPVQDRDPRETARAILRLADEPDEMIGDHVRLARAYLALWDRLEEYRDTCRKLGRGKAVRATGVAEDIEEILGWQLDR